MKFFLRRFHAHENRQKAEEFLRDKTLDQGIAQKAGEIAKPLKDNVYKVKMAQDLIQRGLLHRYSCSLTSGCGSGVVMIAPRLPFHTVFNDSVARVCLSQPAL